MPATKTICESCREVATRKGLDGEPLCDDCLEEAGYAVCADCGGVCDDDAIQETPDGDLWCDSCREGSCSNCENCGNLTWDIDTHSVTISARRGFFLPRLCQSICNECFRAKTVTCGCCSELVYITDTSLTRDDDLICEWCSQEYFRCSGCGDLIHCDLASGDAEGYCISCDFDVNFTPCGFTNQNGCAEIGSARCYGLELETDECGGYVDLTGSVWGAKPDPTVTGKEFFSAILSGDDGLDAIRVWGRLAYHNGWEAGHDAGYHLHLDLRSESDDSRFAIAYAYEKTTDVWCSFVESHRHDTTYSHANEWTCADLIRFASQRDYRAFTYGSTRYNWCNINAFLRHETIEIRLHEGTCNTNAIINWVKAHTRFTDWAAKLGLAEVQKALDDLDADDKFTLISQVWGDSDLTVYYRERAQQLDNGLLTKSIGR